MVLLCEQSIKISAKQAAHYDKILFRAIKKDKAAALSLIWFSK
jgi:hypothetical protein